MATRVGKVTIKDVAADLGVAISTVSNAYNRPDQLSPKLRTRVFATAEKLGYAGPHPAARGLRARSTGQIAVLLNQPLAAAWSDPVTSATLEGLTSALAGRGLALDLTPIQPRGGLPISDGVIVLNPDREDSVLRQAVQGDRPVVLVDSPALDSHPGIEIGDDTAARGVMSHAIGLGHTRIAIVVDQVRSRGKAGRVSIADQERATRARTTGRLRGYRLAALNADLPWTAIPVYAAGADTEVAGRAIGNLVLADVPTPTVVFCTSDRLAAGMLLAAKEVGLSVPGGISVIGFDDTLLSRSTTPPLTTVRLDHRAKGEAAGKAILALIDGHALPPAVRVQPKIVVRESLKEPRSS
jgi:DNA-binding LacI/PurR family transcriptional regulator